MPGGAVELPVRHREGHEIPIELTVAAIETKHGLRFNVFARDITERVEREREREEETAALAALVDVTSRLAGGLDDGVLRDESARPPARSPAPTPRRSSSPTARAG